MQNIISYIVGAVVLYTIIYLCHKPLKWVSRMAGHAVLGAGALYLCNILLGWSGLFVGVNAVTAAIAGLLGIPGVALLYTLSLVL